MAAITGASGDDMLVWSLLGGGDLAALILAALTLWSFGERIHAYTAGGVAIVVAVVLLCFAP